jgi:hypothetical protein
LFLHTEKLNYEQSKDKCKSLGMEIASFDSRSEAQQVFDAVVKLADRVWVGMERNESGRFFNMEKAEIDLPWADDERNNNRGDENCVTTSKDDKGYVDDACDGNFSFICQKVEEQN